MLMSLHLNIVECNGIVEGRHIVQVSYVTRRHIERTTIVEINRDKCT